MSINKLKLNSDKTEFLMNEQQLAKCHSMFPFELSGVSDRQFVGLKVSTKVLKVSTKVFRVTAASRSQLPIKIHYFE